MGEGVRITCTRWRRLFQIQELVYKALCLEFYVTISFRGRADAFDMENLTFCLGGERRECSVAELAWRLDLYNRSEAMTKDFGVFLDTCHMDLPKGVNGANWWTTISNGVHIPSVAQEGDIRSTIHRLIHCFILSTINMRKDANKFPNQDIFFLWSILTPGVF